MIAEIDARELAGLARISAQRRKERWQALETDLAILLRLPRRLRNRYWPALLEYHAGVVLRG